MLLVRAKLATYTYFECGDKVCCLKQRQLTYLVNDTADFGVGGCRGGVGGLPSP